MENLFEKVFFFFQLFSLENISQYFLPRLQNVSSLYKKLIGNYKKKKNVCSIILQTAGENKFCILKHQIINFAGTLSDVFINGEIIVMPIKIFAQTFQK